MTRRKNKQTRKYKPRDEFRYNNSPAAKGHPNYVFGETKLKYKSFGITHSPSKNYRYIRLNDNPNSNDKTTAYVEIQPKTANKRYYSEPLSGYKFSKDDMSIIRQLIKRYKKSTNRHKKRK